MQRTVVMLRFIFSAWHSQIYFRWRLYVVLFYIQVVLDPAVVCTHLSTMGSCKEVLKIMEYTRNMTSYETQITISSFIPALTNYILYFKVNCVFLPGRWSYVITCIVIFFTQHKLNPNKDGLLETYVSDGKNQIINLAAEVTCLKPSPRPCSVYHTISPAFVIQYGVYSECFLT